MLTIVLPIAFFVLTLIIILILRAEDRKSRNLQLVNQQIASYRTETNVTISRMQQTSNDAIEGLDHKIAESKLAETSLMETLSQLQQRSRDLIALEDICANYKVALENLRLQTEQAEARIGAVQKQVEQAGIIHSIVEQFKQDSKRSEDHFAKLISDFNTLTLETEDRLNQISSAQQEKNEENLGVFKDRLEEFEADFAEFTNSEKESLRLDKEAYYNSIKEAEKAFVERKKQLEADIEFKIENIEGKEKAVLLNIEEEKEKLRLKNDEYETEYSACLEELQDQIEAFSESVENGKANLKSTYDELIENLTGNRENLDRLIEDKEREVKDLFAAQEEYFSQEKDKQTLFFEESTSKLEMRLDEINEASEEFKKDAENTGTEIQMEFDKLRLEINKAADEVETTLDGTLSKLDEKSNELNQSFYSSMESFKSKLAKEEETFRSFITELEKDLDLKISQVKSDYNECENTLKSLVVIMNENANQALMDYKRDVGIALQDAFKAEIDKVDNIFDSQKQQIVSMLETMLSRQTDMRELSIRLNQGVDNTIRTAIDKLQNLQSRTESSMEVLRNTQEEVAKTKDELFGYKKQAVEISSKIKINGKTGEKEKQNIPPVEREITDEEFSDEEEELLLTDEDN